MVVLFSHFNFTFCVCYEMLAPKQFFVALYKCEGWKIESPQRFHSYYQYLMIPYHVSDLVKLLVNKTEVILHLLELQYSWSDYNLLHVIFIPPSNQLSEVRNSIIHDLFSNKLTQSSESKFHGYLAGKTGQLVIKLNVVFTGGLLYIGNITKREQIIPLSPILGSCKLSL